MADRFHGYVRDEAGQFGMIDFPNAIETFANAINERGEIAGEYIDSGNIAHDFLFDHGVYTSVALPGVPQNMGSFTFDTFDFNSCICGITDYAEITGVSMTADGNFHGFQGTPIK